jgi:hypothetical protein
MRFPQFRGVSAKWDPRVREDDGLKFIDILRRVREESFLPMAGMTCYFCGGFTAPATAIASSSAAGIGCANTNPCA